MKIEPDNLYSSTPEYICDCKDHNKMAHGSLTICFWYGSKYDMYQGNVNVCDKCADEVMDYIKQKFKIEKFLTKVEEF